MTSTNNTNSIAYNPFADLYVPPVQSSLYTAGCSAYQTQYEPPPVPVAPAVSVPPASTGNKHPSHGTEDNKHHRVKENPQRPPVNWMTSPDVRQHQQQQQQQQQQQFRQPTYMQHHSSNNGATATSAAAAAAGGTDFYFPPFSSKELDIYNSTGVESGNRTRTEYGGYTDTTDQHHQQQQYAWSPSKVAPLHHPLPTLVGDLALGNNTTGGTESSSKRSGKEPTETPSNFLSVSQLVEPGLGKGHTSEQLIPPTTSRNNKKHTTPASRTNSGVQKHKTHREKSTGRHTEQYQRSGYSAEALLATTHNNHQQQQYMYEQYLSGEAATQYTQQQQSHHHQQQQQHQHPHQQQQQQQHYQQQYSNNTSNSSSHHQQQRQQLTLLPPPPAPVELASDYTALLTDTFANFTSKPPAAVPAFDAFSAPSLIIGSSSSTSRATSRHRSSMVDASSEERRRTVSKRNTSSSSSRHHTTSRTSADVPVTTTTGGGGGGFTELGFLSMSAATTIGSPLLPDEFHTHTFPAAPAPTAAATAAASQLYQQNPLYPRHTFVPQPEVRNSSSGTVTTTGANTLTNFNLTTIFPEMNKNVPVASSRSSRTSQHHRHHHHHQQQQQQQPQQQNHQPQQSRHHNQQQSAHGGYSSDRLLHSQHAQHHQHHQQHHQQQQQQQQQQAHNTNMYPQYPSDHHRNIDL